MSYYSNLIHNLNISPASIEAFVVHGKNHVDAAPFMWMVDRLMADCEQVKSMYCHWLCDSSHVYRRAISRSLFALTWDEVYGVRLPPVRKNVVWCTKTGDFIAR
jgi:hypothetical protein